MEDKGYCSARKISKRDKMSSKKRAKDADAIVDELEADGQIKALYRDFKAEIESAHNAEVSPQLSILYIQMDIPSLDNECH